MDISHHYIEEGGGFPLILLHGNGENNKYFVHQIEHFSKTRRVIALDTRGHGKTPRGKAVFTIRQFARDLRIFMDTHKIDQADILGFSDGGNIALIFALQNPQRVRKLILNGANLDASGVKSHIQRPIVWGYKTAAIFAHKSDRARKNAEMLGLMVNDPNIDPAHLAQLHIPTLVITGTRDMIKDEHSEMIARSLPDALWLQIDGDHFIANKNPKDFNRAVEDFLKR